MPSSSGYYKAFFKKWLNITCMDCLLLLLGAVAALSLLPLLRKPSGCASATRCSSCCLSEKLPLEQDVQQARLRCWCFERGLLPAAAAADAVAAGLLHPVFSVCVLPF